MMHTAICFGQVNAKSNVGMNEDLDINGNSLTFYPFIVKGIKYWKNLARDCVEDYNFQQNISVFQRTTYIVRFLPVTFWSTVYN